MHVSRCVCRLEYDYESANTASEVPAHNGNAAFSLPGGDEYMIVILWRECMTWLHSVVVITFGFEDSCIAKSGEPRFESGCDLFFPPHASHGVCEHSLSACCFLFALTRHFFPNMCSQSILTTSCCYWRETPSVVFDLIVDHRWD